MSEPLSRRLGRAYARGAVPIAILAVAIFVGLLALVLPARSGAIDVAKAKRIVAAQWVVPVLMIHLMFVLPGLIAPWLRGDAPLRAARTSLGRAPSIWLHALAAQAMIGLGLFAGVVPGILAIAPAALVAVAVAGGARGTDAIRIADEHAARQRLRVIGIAVVAIGAELALTYAAQKALVPRFEKKMPASVLAGAVLFAWVNAARAAITTPIVATLFAALYDDRSSTPQATSAARTPAASTAATT